jgi:aspartate aminotransferase
MSKLSTLAETLIGSEIVRLGNEINARIKNGETIYNFTIGDFNPEIFPIPLALENEIINAYQKQYTNYPSAEGILPLRESICNFLKHYFQLDYTPAEIQVASGGRPLIYSIYRAIVDKGDKVIYPVPSWNNNHYTHFTEGEHLLLETKVENDFMPTAEELAPHIAGARLIALCSPLNPTGTIFDKQQLLDICNLIIAENEKRGDGKKLYLMFDQIYCTLMHGGREHYNPVSLVPAMREYTIFVDGISKSLAATGVRVGWSMGPAHIIAKVKAILSHVGAWAPMAEQVAVSNYLTQFHNLDAYFVDFKAQLDARLQAMHAGFQALKRDGFQVDSIAPQAAIYLTVKIDLVGKTKADGTVLNTQMDVWQYILDEAHMAIVPFSSFGAPNNNPWYRISIGTCKLEMVPTIIESLKSALAKLS